MAEVVVEGVRWHHAICGIIGIHPVRVTTGHLLSGTTGVSRGQEVKMVGWGYGETLVSRVTEDWWAAVTNRGWMRARRRVSQQKFQWVKFCFIKREYCKIH